MFWRKKRQTKIVVYYDAGMSNTLFIRGEGAPSLHWDKGVPLKNINANEWVYETKERFKEGSFKILINDEVYEAGENHKLLPGSETQIHPQFP